MNKSNVTLLIAVAVKSRVAELSTTLKLNAHSHQLMLTGFIEVCGNSSGANEDNEMQIETRCKRCTRGSGSMTFIGLIWTHYR